MKLSIVICNYNTRDELAHCLDTIEARRGMLETEVIVVDNASADGSADMVRARFPDVALIANPDNYYFARANNQGIDAARGEYVLLLNTDVELQDDALGTLVKYMDAHPDVGALGCQMRYPDGRTQRICARFSGFTDLLLAYTFVGRIFARLRTRRADALWYAGWDRLSARDVEVIPNSCTLIRRAVLEQSGKLNEAFKLYFTEEDWCRRALRDGWALRYIPDAIVIHEEGASVRKASKVALRIYFRDMLVFSHAQFGTLCTALLALALLPTWLMMRLRGTL